MRTKHYKTPEEDPQASDSRPFFPYRSYDDYNGPVITDSIVSVDATGSERRHEFKVVKPYFMASSLGEGWDFSNKISPSSIDYTILTVMRDFVVVDIWDLFPVTNATNHAILNSLETGNLLLAVSAAEFAKTQSMVARVAIRITNLLLDLYRSAKKLDPYEIYQLCSDAWLEIRYGWRPLKGEIESLYDLINSDYDSEALLSKYGKEAFLDLDHVISLPEVLIRVRDIDRDTSYVARFTGSITIKAIYYKSGFNYLNTIDSRNKSILSQLGLDLESIASTAYELIPFSFLLDMVAKIGDLLGAESFSHDVLPFNGYISTNVDYEINGSLTAGEIEVWEADWRQVKRLAFNSYYYYMFASLKANWNQTQISDYSISGYFGKKYITFTRNDIAPSDGYTSIHPVRLSQNNSAYGTSFTLTSLKKPVWPGSASARELFFISTPALWPVSDDEYDPVAIGLTHNLELPFLDSALSYYFEEYNPTEGGQAHLDELAYAWYLYRVAAIDGDVQTLTFEKWLYKLHPSSPQNIRVAYPHVSYPVTGRLPELAERLSFGTSYDNWESEVSQTLLTKRYFRPLLTINDVQPPTMPTTYNSSGRFFERVKNEDIEFIPRINTDLNPSQMIDIAVFAERLVSAIVSTKKN
jgi:hypothetical protein